MGGKPARKVERKEKKEPPPQHSSTLSNYLTAIQSPHVVLGFTLAVGMVTRHFMTGYADTSRCPPAVDTPTCLGDCTNGLGIMEWKYGRYEGGFKNSKKHGLGVHYWPDCAVHEGEYANDRRHGRGVYTWPDEATYMGDYIDGKKTGFGLYTGAEGDSLIGQWKEEKIHGMGVLDHLGETIKEGLFSQGSFISSRSAEIEVQRSIRIVIASIGVAAQAHLQALRLRSIQEKATEDVQRAAVKVQQESLIRRNSMIVLFKTDRQLARSMRDPVDKMYDYFRAEDPSFLTGKNLGVEAERKHFQNRAEEDGAELGILDGSIGDTEL